MDNGAALSAIGYISGREWVDQQRVFETTKAPEGAFVLSAIRRLPVSSELVAEADHVDEGIYVYVDFDFAKRCMARSGLSIDINIADLGVEHE